MTQAPIPLSPRKTAFRIMKVGCSHALCASLNEAFGLSLKEEESASAPLAGGILQRGYQCGMVWGSALAAGAQAHQRFGVGPKAEAAALTATRKLVTTFAQDNRSLDCSDIVGSTMQTTLQIVKYMLKGGPIGCMRIAARYAPKAQAIIEESLREEPPEPEMPTVSCSACVARRMGASADRAVMAAGLAGGVGLSGNACGALGTAVWITALDFLREEPTQEPWNSKTFKTRAEARIERFAKATDYVFECNAIVGRTFTDEADHARYLSKGGCKHILDALSAPLEG